MQDFSIHRLISWKIKRSDYLKEIIKNDGAVTESISNISNSELEIINSYTRRTYNSDELYVFNVVLCDNEIDRDNEAFSIEALHSMSRLFVGKTGISDHNPSASNQTARIFRCSVEHIEGKKTEYGDDYYRLVARAYIPRNDSTKEVIELIESGIRKEVSVGCCAEEIWCSVCGADMRTSNCGHNKGESYEGRKCFFLLDKITDAYEWSFVAVPSQRGAGVIKSYCYHDSDKEDYMEKIINEIKRGSYKALNSENIKQLAEYITQLEQYAEYGKAYRVGLEKDYVKYSGLCFADNDSEVSLSVAKKLSLNELENLVALYKGHIESENYCKPQLCSSITEKNNDLQYNI